MDSLYQLYPQMGPLNKKLAPVIVQQSKVKRQGSLKKLDRNNDKSLMSQYSELCKFSSKEYLSKRRHSHRSKHSHSTLNNYQYGHNLAENNGSVNKGPSFNTIDPLSIVGKASHDKEPRIEKAISSMSIYDQELKNTKGVQNKSKRKVLVMSSKKVNEDFILKSTLFKNDINPESQTSLNHLSTKNSNKSVAFKTINLLYKAIIDSDLRHKEKQEFQVQANKLPIIDRFMTTKRLNKFRQDMLAQRFEKSAALIPLQARSTKMSLYRTISRMSPPKQKTELKPTPSVEMRALREDLDIEPWSTEEQQLS